MIDRIEVMARVERDESGQAAAFVMAVVAALGTVLLVAIAQLGGGMVDRTRAQSVADASALAALDGGRHAAERIAGRHGATVVAWSVGPAPGEVTVTVRIGDATAIARASDAP